MSECDASSPTAPLCHNGHCARLTWAQNVELVPDGRFGMANSHTLGQTGEGPIQITSETNRSPSPGLHLHLFVVSQTNSDAEVRGINIDAVMYVSL